MKSIRWHLVIVIALFIILLGVGSAYDLSISQSLFSPRGTASGDFGIVMAALSTIIAYAILPIFAGILIRTTIKNKKPIYLQIIFYFLSAVATALAIYLSGEEVFGVNGFNIPNLKWLGFVICVPLDLGFVVLGWFIERKINNPRIWVVGLVLIIGLFISMMIGTYVLKSIFHRPRFREIVRVWDINKFMPWYKPLTNYKDILSSAQAWNPSITSEEFKSFPSGHTAFAAHTIILVSFLPLLGKKYAKWQIPCFYVALAWTLLVGISRIIAGAHYLSDISMGALITLVVFFAANEVILNNKKLSSIALESINNE